MRPLYREKKKRAELVRGIWRHPGMTPRLVYFSRTTKTDAEIKEEIQP